MEKPGQEKSVIAKDEKTIMPVWQIRRQFVKFSKE
jgi:hypothetical protein